MKKGMLFVLMMVFAVLFVSGCNNVKKAVDTYPVVVDYSQSLDQMIQAGNYDEYCCDNIFNEYHPINEKGKVAVTLQLVSLDEPATIAGVFAEMDRSGLRPATLPELLAFGAKYPEVQRQFIITTPGYVWVDPVGDHLAPRLCMNYDRRFLTFAWSKPGWRHGKHRFLAVAK